MRRRRRTNPEKAALVADVIAALVLAAVIGVFVSQALHEQWIIESSKASVLRQNSQHVQEELKAIERQHLS